MSSRRSWSAILVLKTVGLACALLSIWTVAWSAHGDAADPQRGREIFRKGVDAEGNEIQAAMGPEGVEVPGSLLPCASCHGHDGRGRPEGGLSPSDLTWDALTKPYGVRHEGGREHPPYDAASLRRAITMGIDSAGNPLNSTMPRYRLTRRDADDLVAYLELLGREKDPGLTDDSLRIATIRPVGDLLTDPVFNALRGYFADFNAKGGIYGRKVELMPIPLAGGTPISEAGVQEIRQALENDPPFALVAPAMASAEQALSALFEDLAMPVVGPFAAEPWLEFPPNRYVFYLYPGIEEQARSLVVFAESRLEKEELRLLVVHSENPQMQRLVEAVQDQARLGGWVTVDTLLSSQEELGPEATASSRFQPGAVILLDSRAQVRDLARISGDESWDPLVLVPGALTGPSLFSAEDDFGDVFAAFPVLPTDTTPAAFERYQELASAYSLPSSRLTQQLSALSAARLLVEALQRVGRSASREKVVGELEKLFQFNTGFTPAVTFNPNRRLGVMGAHIVAVDRLAGRFNPVGERLVP